MNLQKNLVTLLCFASISLFAETSQAITYREYLEGLDFCADKHLSKFPITKTDWAEYAACTAGFGADWVSMVLSPFAANDSMTLDSDTLLASTVTSPVFPSSTSPLNVFLLKNTASSTGFASQDDWMFLGSFNAVTPGQWDITVDANLFEVSSPTNPGSFLAFSFESDSVNFQEMSSFQDQNFGLQFNFTKTTPEPTTIFSLLALGTLGAASTLKRKLKPSQSTTKETTKVG